MINQMQISASKDGLLAKHLTMSHSRALQLLSHMTKQTESKILLVYLVELIFKLSGISQ
jgi:hypothetical protein